jgi:hypothetical protein
MSYNVGVYSPPTGAETAFAGEVIASATWNSINTDYATALNQIGYPYGLGTIKVVVSLSTAATDNPMPVPLLPGFSRYKFLALVLSGANGNPSAGSVALYSAAAAGGLNLVGSTTLTINTSLENTNNNTQTFIPGGANTLSLTASILYLRVVVSTSFQVNATVFIESL